MSYYLAAATSVLVLQVLAMCFVRKSLDWVFTRHELKWLDDIIPESHKREKEEKEIMMMEQEMEVYSSVPPSVYRTFANNSA